MSADNSLALFGRPSETDGPSAAAMRRQIDAWQAGGKAVSLVVRQMLLDQAHAVDLARQTRRATQVSGASRVLLELLQGFHLVDDAPPPADATLTSFIAAVTGPDDAG